MKEILDHKKFKFEFACHLFLSESPSTFSKFYSKTESKPNWVISLRNSTQYDKYAVIRQAVKTVSSGNSATIFTSCELTKKCHCVFQIRLSRLSKLAALLYRTSLNLDIILFSQLFFQYLHQFCQFMLVFNQCSTPPTFLISEVLTGPGFHSKFSSS